MNRYDMQLGFELSGYTSYPLYMTHYPFMWVFANYVTIEEPSMTHLWWVINMQKMSRFSVYAKQKGFNNFCAFWKGES